MAKKFNDKQLSTILSHAHELEWLGARRSGAEGPCPVGCINQAAYNEPYPDTAMSLNYDVAIAFDKLRPKHYTPEIILKLLRKVGAV